MEELFTEKSLVDLLSSLPKRSARQQFQPWNKQKEQRRRTSSILYSLGWQITTSQAKRLDELNLSFPVLCEIQAYWSDDKKQPCNREYAARSCVRSSLQLLLSEGRAVLSSLSLWIIVSVNCSAPCTCAPFNWFFSKPPTLQEVHLSIACDNRAQGWLADTQATELNINVLYTYCTVGSVRWRIIRPSNIKITYLWYYQSKP